MLPVREQHESRRRTAVGHILQASVGSLGRRATDDAKDKKTALTMAEIVYGMAITGERQAHFRCVIQRKNDARWPKM
ncbi:MAG TPA: hypothetical protein VNE82_22445 [Candidatus Binataceae bacterium]|nr:hypothetical protein [Candidatus Binataceae bacterium]